MAMVLQHAIRMEAQETFNQQEDAMPPQPGSYGLS